MNKTINYYNTNAEDFYGATVNADMSLQYAGFEQYLQAGAHILDCGCGSGRDSKYFLEQGYEVTAIDGSEELCRKASELTGLNVQQMLFQEIAFEEAFDGVWACASLLHVPADELKDVLHRIARAMKDGGILYVSFKYGAFAGERNGRFFTDLSEEAFAGLVKAIPGLEMQEYFITEDVRPGRNEKWLNAVVKKTTRKEEGSR